MKRTLRRASLVAKVFGLTLRVMALWAVLGGGGQPAYATHFRYGHISWAPVTGNTIQFTIQNAFRRFAYKCRDPAALDNDKTIPCSAADGLPGPGDVFAEDIGSTQFFPGDGSVIDSPLGRLLYVVTSIDPTTNEWLFALALDPDSLPAIDTTITHIYPSTGIFIAAIDSCCRISPAPFSGTNAHINNPDGGYRVETEVNVGTGNSSPVSALPPIVLCPINALCSFLVPGADPNGDPLRFRFSIASEAGDPDFPPNSDCPSIFCQPGPPFALNAASISSTGLYTWDTTDATLGPLGFTTLYSTQVTIEDLDAAGNVKSKVAVDFLIQLVQIAGGSPPVFNNPPASPVCGSTTTVNVGTTQSFVVQASDPDPGQTVTLNAAGLPVGATMTPLLPTSGNPVSSTFSWTPTAADAGTYVITFTATDNSGVQAGGLQTLCSMTLRVAKNQPPDCSTAAPSVAELWPPNHKFVPVNVLGVTDPDGDPVTITIDSIFQDEPVKKRGTGSGNTCPDATGVGTHTARVRSERGGNPHVPGDGRVYHIGFTGDDGEGGTCTGEVRVCVPHDQRHGHKKPGHSCGDQGPRFDSTVCP